MHPRSLVPLALLAPGCAAAHLGSELRAVETKLAASERTQAALVRKVEDLDNRLFLLADRLESQRVAMTQNGAPFDGSSPNLPVVTLRPPEEAAPEAAPEIAIEGPAVEEPVLEEPRKPRPTVRPESRPPERKAAAPAATLASAGEKIPNLGVVPVPELDGSHPAEGKNTAPIALYREAYDQLMAGHHQAAETTFRQFVHRYPRHDYADNAQYWLGESLYDRKEYPLAAPEFQAVVVRWPSGNKAPDALLKLGYCLLAQGETAKGRDVLGRVAKHYPRTAAAQLAERRLRELDGKR